MRIMKTRFITGLSFANVRGPAATRPRGRTTTISRWNCPAPVRQVAGSVGNELAFHLYARGVQIYRWSGSAWEFVAPSATRSRPGYHGRTIWESNLAVP
jgi:hypothetical protein